MNTVHSCRVPGREKQQSRTIAARQRSRVWGTAAPSFSRSALLDRWTMLDHTQETSNIAAYDFNTIQCFITASFLFVHPCCTAWNVWVSDLILPSTHAVRTCQSIYTCAVLDHLCFGSMQWDTHGRDCVSCEAVPTNAHNCRNMFYSIYSCRVCIVNIFVHLACVN